MLNEVPTQYASAPLLAAQQLAFAYNGSPMLKDVSFAMESGEFVGLLGPNGAGKSTLLKLVGGVMRGGQNDVDLMGKALGRYRANALARMIAYVPQSTALDFAFTVREVVLMGRSPYLGRFQIESAADRAIAETSMRTTDVLPFADRFINTLSGGERQRVIVARALAQEPALLLLDEPTSNLDIKHQLAILELAQSLAHDCGIGVVAAIHDLSLAARFCDRIVLMDDGRIVAQGKPAEVLTPQRLNDVFGVDVIVEPEPSTGGLRLTPLRTVHPVS